MTETEDLKAKIQQLEGYISKLQKILGIQTAQLRETRDRLTAMRLRAWEAELTAKNNKV